MKEAKFYDQLSNNKVHCELCPHQCIIGTGETGKCGVRRNVNGSLITESYGLITAMHVDPMEKKPLYHFKPGSKILSIGSKGCNFKCGFCQNADIAQGNPNGRVMTLDEILDIAKSTEGNAGIAFTYNEPVVGYEFMLDMAKKAKENGLCTVCVSNGFIMPDPLDDLLKYMDAFNIDLKAFSDRFYHQACGGERAPVMESIRRIANTAHVEITLLLIDGENDDPEELEEMFEWMKDISPDIPLHITRYFPNHEYEKPPTALENMVNVEIIAKKYLHYVYIGNVPEADIHTYCPHCGAKVIHRTREDIKVLAHKHSCQVCDKHILLKL